MFTKVFFQSHQCYLIGLLFVCLVRRVMQVLEAARQSGASGQSVEVEI